jgi:hypothetical protein
VQGCGLCIWRSSIDSKPRQRRWCNPKGCVGKVPSFKPTIWWAHISTHTNSSSNLTRRIVMLFFFHSQVHWIAREFDKFISECMVSIINFNLGIKEHAHGYQNYKTSKILIFGGYFKERECSYTCYARSINILNHIGTKAIFTWLWML